MANPNPVAKFKPGNQIGVGNSGPTRQRPVTAVIIAKLNEVNKDTKRENIFAIVDELFEQALPVFVKKNGKIVEDPKTGKPKVHRRGDLQAIMAVMDRADGKPTPQIEGTDGKGGAINILIVQGEDKI